MDNLKNNKNLKVAAGVLVLVLFGLVAYYFMSTSAKFSLPDNRDEGVFNLLTDNLDEDINEKNRWYFGYMNKRSKATSYSQLFETKTECLEYEKTIQETSPVEVVEGCFTIPKDAEDLQGEDIFTSDIYLQEETNFVDKSENVVIPKDEQTQNDTKTETVPEVIKDDLAPAIILNGVNPTYLEVGTLYEDLGATANDVEDGKLNEVLKVTGLPISTEIAGTYHVTYSVTDSAKNYVEVLRIVEVVEPEIDMESDISYLESCYGKMALGLCAVVDVNEDGAVDENDKVKMVEILFPFEVSGDPSISLSLEGKVDSCFIKIGDECAKDVHPDIQVSRTYLTDNTYNALLLSTSPENEYGVILSTFSSKIGDSTLDRIIYDSFAQYDLNEDGVADLNGWTGDGTGINNLDKALFEGCMLREGVGECAKADINRDGLVLMWDLGMFTIMQSTFLPESFTIKDIDMAMFDRTVYSDAVVVLHCVENNIIAGYCEFVDFNGDGAVTSADEKLFFDTVKPFDFNGDDIVDGIKISF